MKKLALVLIIFLLASCTPDNQERKTPTFNDVHSGTDGLVMSFSDKTTFSSDIAEDSEFKTVIELKNKGASDIKNGKIAIITDSYLQPEESIKSFDLQGKSVYNLNGEDTSEVFTIKAKKLDEQSQSQEASIIAIACYDYKTEVRTDVCIDYDYLNLNLNNINKVCTVKEHKMGSEGGPVEVTDIKPAFENSGNQLKLKYIITIRNAGSGMVTKPGDAYSVCNAGSGKTSFNLLETKAKLGINELDCKDISGDKDIHLEDGTGKAVCVLQKPIPKQAPYLTTLQIELLYGYTQTLQKNILIRKD